jgi:hypothetical protein
MGVGGLRGKVPRPGEWEEVQGVLGEVPLLGIGNCDLPTAVVYGCSDADHTGQEAEVLRGLRTGPRWRVDPGDWDD